ncbi:MAG: hypothetical protein HY863_07330 [Chloroflexi bacterium]|nr:hypothetical protein [Chloroflexota bacterium]
MKKSPVSDLIIPVLLLIDGLICALVSIFAHEIGLDPNIAWGRMRYALFILGSTLILFSLLATYFKRKVNVFFELFIKSESVKTFFLLGHLWGIIFVVYAWFITFGNFTTWNHSTHYYTQLADAFGKGQLYVDQSPGALLDAQDPYSVITRPVFQDEIWDMSLYEGKLYLYWGPVPALLITPIQLLLNKKIADIFLVYFFLAGLLLFNSLIILKLWRRFFPNIPAWNVFICIPLIGLILPILWSVNIPDVYEAAIGAGQFFLIGGIYFILSAIEDDLSINKWKIFWAGVFWACSVGSRAINTLSVIFLAAFVMAWIVNNKPRPINWTRIVQEGTPLFVPLIVGAIVIGWYNWARFDSPLEFGLRYQITIFNLNEQMNLTFKPDYFLPNIYNYLLQPFEFISRFPFIQPIKGSGILTKLSMAPPYLYAAGRVTGLLFCAPFLALSLNHLFPGNKEFSHDNAKPYNLLIYLLAGSFLTGFLTILFYFYGQMRFLVDIISQITLLAIIGYWEIISITQKGNTRRSKYLASFANLLIAATICISVLLAFSSETSRMETLNPLLFEKINNFLGAPK